MNEQSLELANRLVELDNKFKELAKRLKELFKDEELTENIPEMKRRYTLTEIKDVIKYKKDEYYPCVDALERMMTNQINITKARNVDVDNIFRILLLDFHFLYNRISLMHEQIDFYKKRNKELTKIIGEERLEVLEKKMELEKQERDKELTEKKKQTKSKKQKFAEGVSIDDEG